MTQPEHAADTAAVMVTHDGERFLARQLQSIFEQTQLPAVLVVVDDASSDRSRSILAEMARGAPLPLDLVFTDGSASSNAKSRIADNFAKGLARVTGYEFVLWADQDDEWSADRVASQRACFAARRGAMLVAGDGILIDGAGQPIGGTLRDRFPVPPDWNALDAAGRMRAALRRPLVTGAAAAISRDLIGLMMPIPRGWLHDRWATLVAAARDGLTLQPRPVINYRIHAAQLMGDRQAQVGRGEARWRQVLRRGGDPLESVLHAADLVHRVRPLGVDPTVRAELTWSALLRSSLERA